MKILNFGSCNVDYVYSMERIVAPGETLSASKMELFPGGKGLNQSVAVAKAGAHIYHAGVIGNDGDMLFDILEKNGVDTTYIKRVDSKNGHAIIQVDKSGENSIFVHKGTNGMITEEFVDYVIGSFEKGDIILLQNEINNLNYIIDKAFEKGLKIYFNPSPFNEQLLNIDLNKIYCLVVNEHEAKEMSGVEKIDDAMNTFNTKHPGLKVVITLGKRGCIYYDGEEVFSQNAFVVKAVDTTAAGDTFTGYFASMCAKGEQSAKAIRYACAASAISVSREGAAPSIPHVSEVKEHLMSFKESNYSKITKEQKLIQQINEYISNNITTANINELAKLLGYSKAYCGILIKSLTGKPFSELLQFKRCERAATLLTDTDLSISDIINNVGYENESFFRKKFSSLFGLSPLKYRKNGGKIQ